MERISQSLGGYFEDIARTKAEEAASHFGNARQNSLKVDIVRADQESAKANELLTSASATRELAREVATLVSRLKEHMEALGISPPPVEILFQERTQGIITDTETRTQALGRIRSSIGNPELFELTSDQLETSLRSLARKIPGRVTVGKLERANIVSVADAISKPKDFYLGLRYFGETSFNHLVGGLYDNGIVPRT